MYKLTLLSFVASAALSSAVYAAEQTNATEASKVAAPTESVEKKDEAKTAAKKVAASVPTEEPTTVPTSTTTLAS